MTYFAILINIFVHLVLKSNQNLVLLNHEKIDLFFKKQNEM